MGHNSFDSYWIIELQDLFNNHEHIPLGSRFILTVFINIQHENI